MTTVAVAANCLYGPNLGGHTWVYLNWALGARAAGCEVVWVEGVSDRSSAAEVSSLLETLRRHLAPFGFASSVVLVPWGEAELDRAVGALGEPAERAYDADVLLDLVYDLPERVVRRFDRSALVNIDPGLLEMWWDAGHIAVAAHDALFTIGGRVADDGRGWRRTRPCVALDEWPVTGAGDDAAFTTVSSWYGNEWIDGDAGPERNDKRTAYLPYVDVPLAAGVPMELAIDLADDPDHDRRTLEARGWRVADGATIASTPDRYRDYVRSSLGEFGCAKPFYVQQRTGWLSDRSACYLASGKPVVVQDTGPHDLLDGAGGISRFEDAEGAVRSLRECLADYERRCKEARSFAEEHLDAAVVVGRVIEETV